MFDLLSFDCVFCSFYFIPCLALPSHASPCPAMPSQTLSVIQDDYESNLALPCLASPCLAEPSQAPPYRV